MKRFLTTALILGSFSTFGLVGCGGDETKVKETSEIKTPTGTEKTTTETKTETSGDATATRGAPATPPAEPPK